MQSWTIRRYLKTQLHFIVASIVSIVLVSLFLFQTVENQHIVWFTISLQVTIVILALTFDYFRKKKFYVNLTMYESEDSLSDYATFEEAVVVDEVLNRLHRKNFDEVSVLKENQREYTEYVETWVHEIKTPIAAARLLVENSGDLKIKNELSDIEDYVEQAMFYARSSHVGKDYLLKVHNLEDLVKECIRTNKRYFMISKISVGTIDCDEEVLTDEKWMLFVLNQIVRNAIKYSRNGGSIDFTCIRHHSAVELQIRDYGVGIQLEDLPRIFDKGFTGQNGRDIDTHATGLGLYLAKRLCNAMHHELRVSSTIGNTVFSIWFPIEKERLEVESYKTVR